MQLVFAGLSDTGFGISGTLVTVYAFRNGLRKAWFAMWLFPLVYWGAAIRMHVEPCNVGFLYVAFALLSLIAPLIPIRKSF